MKAIAISLFAILLCGLAAASAHEWDRDHGGSYGYYGGYDDYAGYWRSYERGYHGEPYFFRSWHDRVRYYPWRNTHGVYVDSYLPPVHGLYSEDRGYGVEGRGWQLP